MLLVDDDQGIGQRFPDIAAVVDYISPMVYPSHFPEGSIAVPGSPNDFPYDVIQISLSLGMQKIAGLELKVRPWIQDFTLPGMSEYGPTEIRAEIQAAEDPEPAAGWSGTSMPTTSKAPTRNPAASPLTPRATGTRLAGTRTDVPPQVPTCTWFWGKTRERQAAPLPHGRDGRRVTRERARSLITNAENRGLLRARRLDVNSLLILWLLRGTEV